MNRKRRENLRIGRNRASEGQVSALGRAETVVVHACQLKPQKKPKSFCHLPAGKSRKTKEDEGAIALWRCGKMKHLCPTPSIKATKSGDILATRVNP